MVVEEDDESPIIEDATPPVVITIEEEDVIVIDDDLDESVMIIEPVENDPPVDPIIAHVENFEPAEGSTVDWSLALPPLPDSLSAHVVSLAKMFYRKS